MPVTEEQVLEALRPVLDPELHLSIVELDMIKQVRVDGDRVGVVVALTVAAKTVANFIDKASRLYEQKRRMSSHPAVARWFYLQSLKQRFVHCRRSSRSSGAYPMIA